MRNYKRKKKDNDIKEEHKEKILLYLKKIDELKTNNK